MFCTWIFRLYYYDVKQLPYLWHLFSRNHKEKLIIDQIISVTFEVVILSLMICWWCKENAKTERLLVFGCLFGFVVSLYDFYSVIINTEYFYIENYKALVTNKYDKM